ncbi:hypothetical protein ACFQ4C_07455 [Larkinella insperata]|uniref:DUF1573 domain-containing protein n=1 Tax=Larkinella insperata TaxID=332158 RepID=A0ABW3QGD4_9BACT
MKKLLVLTSLLLSALFMGSSFTPKKPVRQPVLIQITMHQQNDHLWAKMTFSNHSGKPVYLNKLDIGLSPRLMNKFFIVTQKGQEVPYTGVMVKRRPPTKDDFVVLAPGKRIRTSIRLDDSYALKAGTNRYSIQYRHYHGSPTDDTVFQELLSKPYFFTYKP